MGLPESTLVAGSKIKVTVGIYDRQKPHKLCEKKILGILKNRFLIENLHITDDEGVAVRLTVTHQDTSTKVYENQTSIQYKTAKICFTDVCSRSIPSSCSYFTIYFC